MIENRDDQAELERLIRAGLERHAAEVDTSVPVASRARAAARRRRSARVAVGSVCAVSVIAVAAVALDLVDGLDRSEGPAVGTPTEGSGHVSEWRTEYWRDMQVDVPAGWGFGGAPMSMPEDGSGARALACGAVAIVSADGEKLGREDPAMPYVGRPIAQTDVCAAYPWIGPNSGPPMAPYVWLGAAVEPGTVELGDGYVEETVEVNGSRLTVATQDANLRRQILESADGAETCLPEMEENTPLADPMDPTAASDARMTVCVYRSSGEDESIPLVYATRVGSQAVAAYLAAVASAAPAEDCSTSNGSESEWAVLEINRDDEAPLRHVVHFGGCPGIATAAGTLTTSPTVTLTPELVRPWAVQGIPAVLYGPTGGKGAMLESFIGPQG
jgi:hypothetical protein